ncbi:MAG: Zn-ribbon domain-containing OB-fold protein [Pseudomonadales bacterium]
MMRFLPEPGPLTQPFWDGCAAGELRVQHCEACAHRQFYPRLMCTACGSDAVRWGAVSGRGVLRSFTVVRRPVTPAYADAVPYVIVLVALAEGPTLMSQLSNLDLGDGDVDVAALGVTIGAAVEVLFEPWSDSITMPLFQLCSSGTVSR